MLVVTGAKSWRLRTGQSEPGQPAALKSWPRKIRILIRDGGQTSYSIEYSREVAHLRPRTNLIGAVARVRHTLAQAPHRFFDEQGFLGFLPADYGLILKAPA